MSGVFGVVVVVKMDLVEMYVWGFGVDVFKECVVDGNF